MQTEAWAPLIAVAGVLVSAGVAAWVSLRVQANSERQARAKIVFRVREALASAAFDLQSRLHNIHEGHFLSFYNGGSETDRDYSENSTVFRIAQYFCWAEIIRLEIQFIDLDRQKSTRRLNDVLNELGRRWASDKYTSSFRYFSDEQRAVGEAMIRQRPTGNECLGYGEFLKEFTGRGEHALFDALHKDFKIISGESKLTGKRLADIQRLLIDLLDLIDPKCVRFPKERRRKVLD